MLPCFFFVLFYVFGVYANSEKYSSPGKRTFNGYPRRNITCLGSSYDLQLPIRSDGFNPNEITVQQLCAKTVYGGAPQGQNLGGWCSKGLRYSEQAFEDEVPIYYEEDNRDYATSTDPQGVSFDFLSLDHDYPGGWDPRFQLGCFNRCFCNYGIEDLTIQPKRDVPSAADVTLCESDGTGELMLDVNDDLLTLGGGTDGRLGNVEVDTVWLHQMVEPSSEDGNAILKNNDDPPWRLSMDAGNYITCDGELPSFPLPEPYPKSDFPSPQELCAVQFSGGLS